MPAPVLSGCAGRPSTRHDLEVSQAVGIGPVAFLGLGRPRPPARFRNGAAPVQVLALLGPHTHATIAIDPTDGVLVATDGALRASVLCETGDRQEVFALGIEVPGPRCARILVASGGQRWTRHVPFGVRRCTR